MNGHSSIDTSHATQLLKDILNVGKGESNVSGRSNNVSNGQMESTSETLTDNQQNENLKTSVQNQKIILTGNDEDFSFGIHAQDVIIYPSSPLHSSGSSKITIHNVVDYSWEQKSYVGRLVSVHLSGSYLAYSLRVYNSPSGMVRILKPQTGERTLVKGMTGDIKDLAFSYSNTDVLLACVDEIGSLYVYEIVEQDGKLMGKSVVQIIQPRDTIASDFHRIIWCPYIPEEPCSIDEENSLDDVSKLLVVTHNEKVEIVNIDIITKQYGNAKQLNSNEVEKGIHKICKHNRPITDAALSPDGTALATASIDGNVKFFQVLYTDKSTTPRCLHQWEPHKGKPLSSLFFLDNHKNPNPDVQFWKFAITGADKNQELKLWSCETWICLQTIKLLISVYNSPSGMVRILKPQTGERTLVKGMTGDIKDLAFSYSNTDVLLACVDEIGSLYVYEIVEQDGKLMGKSVVQIIQPRDTIASDFHRIIWCPYIPEEPCSIDEENSLDDVSKLLVVTHNEKVEIVNIDIITKQYGNAKQLNSNEVEKGIHKICKHNRPITDAALSPDGTALATASIDGNVKFFQVLYTDKSTTPRCLHQWEPHKGKPLSSLFFLDNHKNPNPDVQFWKFAITGADKNQELKLWSCETWICLQTIKFVLNDGDNMQMCLNAELDLSSSYLLLTDINRKVLYILQIHQDPVSSQASFCSISEFLLTYPILSFAITDVSRCKYKPSTVDVEHVNAANDDKNDFEGDEVSGNEKYIEGNVVKLFWIHTKSLQACRIVYEPMLSIPIQTSGSVSSLSQESFGYHDKLCDLSLEVREVPKQSEESVTMLLDSAASSSTVISPSIRSPLTSHLQSYKGCGEVLLTPDDFTSPPAAGTIPPVSTYSHSPLSLPLKQMEDVNHVSSPPKSPIDKRDDNEVAETETSEPLPDSSILPRRKSSQHSSTSSPSREVAEIMAPSKLLNSGEQEEPGLEEQQHDMENNIVSEDAKDICNHGSSLDIASTNDLSHRHNEYRANGWPQAPDPTKEYRVIGTDERGDIHENTNNQHSCALESIKESFPSNQLSNKMDYVLHKLEGSVKNLQENMNILLELIHSQRHQLQEVKQEIKEFHQQDKTLQCLLQQVDKLEDKLSANIEHIVAVQSEEGFRKLEPLFARKGKMDHLLLEKQATALSQTVTVAITNKLDKTIKNEIKNSVLPHVSKFLDILKDQLQQEVSQKLVSSDNIIRESIGKLAKNKIFSESLGQSVVSLVQPHIQMTCRDVFQTTTVPAFEKACQNLFYQLNESFQRGTEEFFKGYRQQEEMLSKLKTVIQEEVKAAIAEHQLSVRALQSNMVSPIPQLIDPQIQQQQIRQLLQQGQINAAFQQALTAADLNLVIFTCETANPNQIFSQIPCPLQQPVLLSLIQQLSGDISTHTELKLKYLEEAVMNLDTKDTRTQQHLPSILGSLHQKLTTFIQNNPSNRFSRHKILLLATQSLLNR
ncbi:enhancer of mRNA-decapping protein 4-like [Centruroides sculpturatus]|uniref:enhancer of mRNA-decapping protein 4-like n=1 Tax=Centruroides sculpturatus TaxID=218467 RepID=UPI000C6E0BFC|nr:enhancer of mRNA-decapping protein 4-like [Centruroides sculpturatus]